MRVKNPNRYVRRAVGGAPHVTFRAPPPLPNRSFHGLATLFCDMKLWDPVQCGIRITRAARRLNLPPARMANEEVPNLEWFDDSFGFGLGLTVTHDPTKERGTKLRTAVAARLSQDNGGYLISG